MNLRDAIVKVLSEAPVARGQPFRDHPLASFFRTDFAKVVETIISGASPSLRVEGSPGAGNWASVPWVALLDPTITVSTQNGVYPVFLFREDMSGVYLSLNQGTTGPIKRFGRLSAMKQAKELAARLRLLDPRLSSWSPSIDLRSTTPLGKSYEEPNIGAKFYASGTLPSLENLERDLVELVMIYESLRGSLLAEANTPIHSNGLPIPKPFLLLAGISGTGKTQWVRERELSGKNNVKVIPVRPDWHEPSDLLGYASRISAEPVFVATTGFPAFLLQAWRDSWSVEQTLTPSATSLSRMTPHWLCLDEMNLAPVEQYFADYLSVLEGRKWTSEVYQCPPLLRLGEDAELIRKSLPGVAPTDSLWAAFLSAKDPGIPLPPNLIVVGTVNMDETTHTFSRKVLDRALTVEFDDVDFSRFGGSALDPDLKTELPWTGLSSVSDANDLTSEPPAKQNVLDLLEQWNQTMAFGPFRIAYRTINESLLIAASFAEKSAGEVLDWVVMTKLLPRLEGDEEKLRSVTDEGKSVLDHLLEEWPGRFGEMWSKSRSYRKLQFMLRRLKQSAYTSFWP